MRIFSAPCKADANIKTSSGTIKHSSKRSFRTFALAAFFLAHAGGREIRFHGTTSPRTAQALPWNENRPIGAAAYNILPQSLFHCFTAFFCKVCHVNARTPHPTNSADEQERLPLPTSSVAKHYFVGKLHCDF